MMTTGIHRNVGGVDRGLRLAAGAVLSAVGSIMRLPSAWRAALLGVGVVALTTGLTGYCPLNQLLGVDTRHG